MPLKIAIYAIARNEAAFAERFMASCAGADLVLVADTGSSDDTASRLAALGAEVRSIRIDPWRFDKARNAALALAPTDVDVCVSLDLDQTLSPGWRQIVEQAWAAGATQLYYHHVYTPAGAGGEVVFRDNRIHARHGYEWRYACHECVVPTAGTKAQTLTDLRLQVLHRPDPTKSRADYLPLLEMAAREAPKDPRAAHYLAREYFQRGRYAAAVREFERYFRLIGEAPAFERNASLRLLAHCVEELGAPDQALADFEAAAAQAPQMRGAWVSLAWARHRRGDWAGALAAAHRAIALTGQSQEYGDDTSPGVVVEDLAALACWALGWPRTALDYAREALAKAPDSARLRANVERIQTVLAQEGPQRFAVSLTSLTEGAAATGAPGGADRPRPKRRHRPHRRPNGGNLEVGAASPGKATPSVAPAPQASESTAAGEPKPHRRRHRPRKRRGVKTPASAPPSREEAP